MYEPQIKVGGKVETEGSYTIYWYTQNWNMNRTLCVFINTKHIKDSMKKTIEAIRKNNGYQKKIMQSKKVNGSRQNDYFESG